QRLARLVVAALEQIVVLPRRDVVGALDVAADEIAHFGFVESSLLSRKQARVGTRYSITEPLSNQSTVAERTNSANAALGGGRPRSPGVAGEVLTRTSDWT